MAVMKLDIQSYLQLAAWVKQGDKRSFWLSYDGEADVMYINFHWPPQGATDSEVTEDNVVIRYHHQDIVGITILAVSQRSPIVDSEPQTPLPN